jgi:hypothetical protein
VCRSGAVDSRSDDLPSLRAREPIGGALL